jgi:hypothetical protein
MYVIMRLRIALIAILAASLLSGCISSGSFVPSSLYFAARRLNHEAEASGSAYRYRAVSEPGGYALIKYRTVPPSPSPIPANLQPTTANAELRKDILAKIDAMQRAWDSDVTPTLLGVQPLGLSGGSFKEAWFIKQGDGAIRYVVTLTQSPKGGTDFEIEWP